MPQVGSAHVFVVAKVARVKEPTRRQRYMAAVAEWFTSVSGEGEFPVVPGNTYPVYGLEREEKFSETVKGKVVTLTYRDALAAVIAKSSAFLVKKDKANDGVLEVWRVGTFAKDAEVIARRGKKRGVATDTTDEKVAAKREDSAYWKRSKTASDAGFARLEGETRRQHVERYQTSLAASSATLQETISR